MSTEKSEQQQQGKKIFLPSILAEEKRDRNGNSPFHIHATIWDAPENIREIHNNFNKIANALNTDKTETLIALVEFGMKAAFEYLSKESGDLGFRPEDVKFTLAVHEELNRIKNEQLMYTKWERLYKARGHEAFVEFCEENGQTPAQIETILRRISIVDAKKSWTRRVEEWLQIRLKDGEPVNTETLKREAVEIGFLESHEDEKRWAKLRSVASRKDYTDPDDNPGFWQLPDTK